MDISKSILYRGLELNGVVLGTGRVLRGIAVESVDYSNVSAVGYTEKRAGADGIHASDVWLGPRQIDMAGHIYAVSLPEMFDYLHRLRSVFSPTSAYQESPGDRGFLPMQFFQSTLDVTSFPAIDLPDPTPDIPAGVVPLYMNVRPNPPRFVIVRDRQDVSGANHGQKPVAIPWSVQLTAKDPRVYIAPGKVIDISGPINAPAGTTVDAVNRGDYETPLNIQLVVGNLPGGVGTVKVKGLNNVDMTIIIENVANVTYRWLGDDRVLMTQDMTPGVVNAPLNLRMDLVSFATANHKPMVPANINPPSKPYSTPVTYTKAVNLDAGSRLFWSEAFA